MKLSIGTFNLQNLTRAGKPIYEDTQALYSRQKYGQKIAWVRGQLDKMNADIVGFQELIEDEALRDCLKGTRFARWHLASATPNGRIPVNAILSRYPITRIEVIPTIPFSFEFFDERYLHHLREDEQQNHDALSQPVRLPVRQFSRALLKVDIQIPKSLRICVTVVHLKSKRPILPAGLDRDRASPVEIAQGSIRSLIRRGVESAGVRSVVSAHLEQRPHVPIIVLGDLNDSDAAVTNQVILGDFPFHSLSPEEKIKRWQYVLQNSRDVQARRSLENYYYTYIYNGHYESLDNIFVSNHFADRNPQRMGRIIDVRLFNDHLFDQTLSPERKPRHVSDHGQVVTNIDIFT